MGGGGTIQQKLESNSAGSPFLLIHSIPGVGAQSSALAECYRVAGGASLAGWRDPRVPLQLVGASTTSNQPSLPSSWRGEWANKTSDSSNSNQSSHLAEPVHCVKIQIKSNLWVGNHQSLTYRSCHSHSIQVSSKFSFGLQSSASGGK